jgi:dephospho-CoA kinase
MKQIGITGGIGAGKSLVCKVFRTLGIPIYESDLRARWLMENDALLRQQIIAQFGTESYTDKGLNRPYLAQKVFHDKEQASVLDALVHPAVGKDYQAWANTHRHAPYLLNEAALIFEAGRYKTLDHVIVVLAPTPLRVMRVRKRDPQRTESEIEGIIKKQWSDEQKIALAQFVIHNDEVQPLLPQILAIHAQIQQM